MQLYAQIDDGDNDHRKSGQTVDGDGGNNAGAPYATADVAAGYRRPSVPIQLSPNKGQHNYYPANANATHPIQLHEKKT
ncbi:hypothetical protein CVT25_000576 [Psilocybe cyanescens]|uniref:Uncharacterized protein n=1 Tax=Psilocybe cyanescens TaxID=93625 RepID=A0A409WZU6_PSICY|nr:hypothetical protein CVT25_000576 [Psilocybe cyanescens]